MTYQRDQIKSILSRVVVWKGRRAGLTLGPSSVNTYTAAFMKVYRDLGAETFDAEILEEYLDETSTNPTTKKNAVIAVNHVVKHGAGFSDDVRADIQDLCLQMCRKTNDPETIKASWFQKIPLLLKYRSVSYKELLLGLAAGAEQRMGGGDFIGKQAAVAFALISANAPLRSDYRDIVIAERCDPLPARTPYYLDGKVYFPDGSRVKTGRGSPTLDVGECRELIDAFISEHTSRYLIGCHMEANTFSHLLLDETQRQLGDKLGIRFFRGKFASEHRAAHRAVNHQNRVMDHDPSTHETFYLPPIEFDDALNAPMQETDVEMVEGEVGDVEMTTEDEVEEMEDAAKTLLSFMNA